MKSKLKNKRETKIIDNINKNLKVVFINKLIFNVSNFPKKLFALKLFEKYQFGNPQANAPAKIAKPEYSPHSISTAIEETRARPRFIIIIASIKDSNFFFTNIPVNSQKISINQYISSFPS